MPSLGVLQYVYHRPYRENYIMSRRLMRERLLQAKSLYRKDLIGHFGCVNAIEFSPGNGEWIVSGGDDRRVLLWNTEECISGVAQPQVMKGHHHSNIFCLAFDNNRRKILSGGNDEQVVLHDIESGETLDVFRHEEAVYGLSVDPINNSIFASACDDGRILIYDTRAPPSEDPFCLACYASCPMHAVMYNPDEPRLLATANSKEGVGLWDIRKPRSALLRYGGSLSQQSCMSVRFNQAGTQLIALRRRLPPVLYNVSSPVAMYQFDHAGYYNSCTMKSCCFAGDQDQWVVSGSDDFNLYMWLIPEESAEVPWVGEAQLVLKGHRSIVNQVRCNPYNQLIVSSGVEKVVKMWSPFPLPGSHMEHEGEITADDAERPVYTHEEYINLLLSNGHGMAHDYTTQSTEEDPRMIAFFDSLVQRELEGWSSDDSIDTSSDFLEHFVQPSASSSDSNGEPSRSDTELDGRGAVVNILLSARSPDMDLPRVLDADEPAPAQLLDLDRQAVVTAADHTDPSRPLLGQQALANRRSISDLITQRRKEYLTGIRKAEREARRNRKQRQRMVLARKQRRAKLLLNTSTTESDGNSSDANSETGKQSPALALTLSSDTDSVSSDTMPNNLQLPDIALSKNKKEQILKLKRLRDRLMNEDSESGDSAARTNGEPLPSTSAYLPCVLNHSSHNEAAEVLHDPLWANGKPNSSHITPANGLSGHNGIANGKSGHESTSIESAKHRAAQSSDTNANSSNDDRTSTDDARLENHTSNNNNADEGNDNGNIDAENEAPTWTRFKRFRNKLERARRKYRRNSQQDSSTDDV